MGGAIVGLEEEGKPQTERKEEAFVKPHLATGVIPVSPMLAGRLFRAGDAPDADAIASGTLVLLRRMLCVEPELERNRRVA
jgi:hypothetical protein